MKKDTLKTQSECKNCEGGGIFYWKDVNGVMQKSSCHCGIPPKHVPDVDTNSVEGTICVPSNVPISNTLPELLEKFDKGQNGNWYSKGRSPRENAHDFISKVYEAGLNQGDWNAERLEEAYRLGRLAREEEVRNYIKVMDIGEYTLGAYRKQILAFLDKGSSNGRLK